MHTVIIGSPDDIRIKLFQQALIDNHYPSASVVSYIDLITGSKHLAALVRPQTLVRIESPGKDERTNQALLELGAQQRDEERGYAQTDPKIALSNGRIASSRQWYLGLRALMYLIQTQLKECTGYRLMNHPEDIITMFDKRACHTYLQAHEINVPPALPAVMNFDELIGTMTETGVFRVFIKPAHGSSASGVVAFQTNGKEYRATGAIEMVTVEGEVQLYNSRHVRTYSDLTQIVPLINTLCHHRVHVEQWIPKARMENRVFDLRVVVVDGEAAHTVGRLSDAPMTNLHLLNERRDREAMIHHMGEEHFTSAMALCRKAMACFPRSLYCGIDLLMTPGFKQHYVLEMNAFGDLLHGARYAGVDPYTLELQRVADLCVN